MKNDDLDPRLFDLLAEVKPVASRDSHAAARGRARFLTEAVSLREQSRHNGWKLFPFKEKLAMNIFISALVIVGLLFGGSATVSAAQDDLPTQSLYQVKLMSESVRLWWVSDPAQQIDILMEQTQTRLQEMQELSDQGVMPPAEVAIQAQEHIQRALQIAAQLDEASQLTALQQIRTRLQTQEQQMLQLQQGSCIECVPVLQQTHEMLRLQLKEVENKLADPTRVQDQNQNQTQTQNQLRINQTPQTSGTTIPPYGTCTPVMDGSGQQNGSGSLSGATPVQQQDQSGQGSGSEGGSPTGSGGGSGGQGGKP